MDRDTQSPWKDFATHRAGVQPQEYPRNALLIRNDFVPVRQPWRGGFGHTVTRIRYVIVVCSETDRYVDSASRIALTPWKEFPVQSLLGKAAA